jgi:hypothetical protein
LFSCYWNDLTLLRTDKKRDNGEAPGQVTFGEVHTRSVPFTAFPPLFGQRLESRPRPRHVSNPSLLDSLSTPHVSLPSIVKAATSFCSFSNSACPLSCSWTFLSRQFLPVTNFVFLLSRSNRDHPILLLLPVAGDLLSGDR